LLELLNRSAMAEVYVAQRAGDDPVVLKRVLPQRLQDESFLQLFAHESYLGTRVANPGLPTVLEEGHVDSWPYMLLLPCPGLPLVRLLAAALTHRRRLAVATALHLTLPLARAIFALHSASDAAGQPLAAIHMDVAPHNVLVSPEGDTVLIDFGIARSRRLNTSMLLRGRSAYLAPEQLLVPPPELDARVDIFAFGTLLHETLCCQPLFRAATEEQTLYRIRHAMAPALPLDLPHREQLDPLLKRCLARDPAGRYDDSGQLVEALEDVAETVSLSSHASTIANEIKSLHVLAAAREQTPAIYPPTRNERSPIRAC
jgi:serine/threonine protein kinase